MIATPATWAGHRCRRDLADQRGDVDDPVDRMGQLGAAIAQPQHPQRWPDRGHDRSRSAAAARRRSSARQRPAGKATALAGTSSIRSTSVRRTARSRPSRARNSSTGKVCDRRGCDRRRHRRGDVADHLGAGRDRAGVEQQHRLAVVRQGDPAVQADLHDLRRGRPHDDLVMIVHIIDRERIKQVAGTAERAEQDQIAGRIARRLAASNASSEITGSR